MKLALVLMALCAAGVHAQEADQAPLRLCLAPVRQPHQSSRYTEIVEDSGANFRALSSAEDTDGCDLLVIMTRAGTSHWESRHDWDAVSPKSGAVLAKGQVNNTLSMGRTIRELMGLVERRFAPGTTLHAKLLAQKTPEEAAPAGGVSKAELQELVTAAVAGANAGRAGPPAPAPQAAEPSSDVDAPKYAKAAARPHDLAVVVGVEKYVDLPDARFAERDARAVRSHLVQLGYPERNVVLLTGERASRASLVKTVDTWLGQNVKEDSTVFFYFSGHGAPDVKTGEAYLVPRDGDPAFLEDTGYPLKRLYAKLGALKAKRAVVALDACFSGAGARSVLPKGARPLVTKIDTGAVAGRVVSLTASGALEISGTDEAQGHGLFTYYLLRGLNGAAKNEAGAVTLASLHEYLTPNVQDEARRQNRQQTPQLLSGDKDGARLRLR